MSKIHLYKLGLKLVEDKKNYGSGNSTSALDVTVDFVRAWGVRRRNLEEVKVLSRKIQIDAVGEGAIAWEWLRKQ